MTTREVSSEMSKDPSEKVISSHSLNQKEKLGGLGDPTKMSDIFR